MNKATKQANKNIKTGEISLVSCFFFSLTTSRAAHSISLFDLLAPSNLFSFFITRNNWTTHTLHSILQEGHLTPFNGRWLLFVLFFAFVFRLPTSKYSELSWTSEPRTGTWNWMMLLIRVGHVPSAQHWSQVMWSLHIIIPPERITV